MKELKLKGYVTPADCENDLQKALDTAKELDICKVVIQGDYTAKRPVSIPSGAYLVVCNGILTADLIADGGENYSFAKKWITIEGDNGTICGNLTFFNAANVTVQNIQVQGSICCEYVNWMRFLEVTAEVLIVGRGCTNGIIQKLYAEQLRISGDHSCGRIVPGSKPDVTNVIAQDCACAVAITAAADCGVLNIQAQGIQGQVVVGDAQKLLPAEQFMNLTLIEIQEGIQLKNPTKHAYIK